MYLQISWEPYTLYGNSTGSGQTKELAGLALCCLSIEHLFCMSQHIFPELKFCLDFDDS